MSAESEAARGAVAAKASGGAWVTARTGPGGYRTEIAAGGHALVADESGTVGGSDGGPSPYELLLSAIGACTAMTMRMYAARKQWPLEDVTVRLRNGRRHAEDCANCEKQSVGIQRIERQIEMQGDLTAEQRERLLYIADRCPVKQTLTRGIEVVSVE